MSAHLILLHFRRNQHLIGHPAWDYACDLEANHLLYNLNITNVKPIKKKWMGLSAEEIFIKMLSLNDDNGKTKMGDNHEFWKELLMDVRDAIKQSIASRMLSPEQINDILEQSQQLLRNKLPFLTTQTTAGHQAGSIVETISVPSVKPVRFKLKNVLDAVLLKRRGFSQPEYDFLFLWQHKYAEVTLPLYPKQIIIGVDTSGSISQQGLRACAAITNYIVTTLFSIYPTVEIYVALMDANLQQVWTSRLVTEFLDDFLSKMKGRGGTEIFKSTQKLIDQENLSPDAIILISDFDTSDSDNDLKTDAPIIGIILNENRDADKTLQEKQKAYKKVKFVASLYLEEVLSDV